MIKWVNGFAPVRVLPTPKSAKILDLPEKALVEIDELTAPVACYEHLFYRTDRQIYTGWMHSGWLEEYIETLPKDCIEFPDQTPDPRDAEQFFMWLGVRQVNICGEACASWILGVKLAELLPYWRDHKSSIWRSVFSNNFFRGTSDLELISIFEAYAQRAARLTDALRDPLQQRSRYTVSGLKDLIATGDVIASCTINNAGRLRASGALHWVVITAVMPERAGYGFVEIFNPYPNRIERYSWGEFVTSARVPYGVYIHD